MTIIKPHKSKNLKYLLAFLFVVFLAVGLVYIFSYNSFVNARYELKELKKQVVELQAINADLKNKFYDVVKSEKLQALALERGLILEKRPEYIKSNQWLSDLSR
ncbi:MAG: FtsL-like putative cell division protein [Patescibacteria group bacterium]|nr:FtsL-like putative cell division protein [Patescibacteria group bacterium]